MTPATKQLLSALLLYAGIVPFLVGLVGSEWATRKFQKFPSGDPRAQKYRITSIALQAIGGIGMAVIAILSFVRIGA
jgi:preprotein translocase subunit Sss1